MFVKPKAIDNDERRVLTIVAVLSTLGGLFGGILLCLMLDGDRSVQSGFWTALLTVSALSALPLVAMTTHVARLWASSSSPTWLSLAPLAMIAAAAVALVEIVLCLYQLGVTSGAGDPSDVVVALTTIPAGATVGAAVFGVAAAILDKIDEPARRRKTT